MSAAYQFTWDCEAVTREMNSLPMYASSEVEPGPNRSRPGRDPRMARVLDGAASREADALAPAVGWGGFGPG